MTRLPVWFSVKERKQSLTLAEAVWCSNTPVQILEWIDLDLNPSSVVWQLDPDLGRWFYPSVFLHSNTFISNIGLGLLFPKKIEANKRDLFQTSASISAWLYFQQGWEYMTPDICGSSLCFRTTRASHIIFSQLWKFLCCLSFFPLDKLPAGRTFLFPLLSA